MHSHAIAKAALLAAAVAAAVVEAQSLDQLVARNATLRQMEYQGRQAIQIVAAPDADNGESYAVLKGMSFRDGAIEVDLVGKPAAGASAGARGFVGIAFRLQNNEYEYIYLRPTNGRADDQVRRNHSTQYGAHPSFDFGQSRKEAPEKYESYVDLQPGVWTKYRIEIDGRKARLFVHGAEQPCLIVNDLKLEPRNGGVALWVGPGTEAYFSGLKITPKGSASSRKVYFDLAHGQAPPPPEMAELSNHLGFALDLGKGPITTEALAGSQLVYLRAPNQAFAEPEKRAIVSFVQAGGSLLVALDEERRQQLAVVGANDLIAPFGLKLSGDTPRIENTGAIAKPGEINKTRREIPYDGGREVFGGTPFAYQLDREGQPAQPFAAYAKSANGGRVVALGEGMVTLFLGVADAERLKIQAPNPKWWGRDSMIFMEEVLAWLLAR